jgi:hypothetical protein
MLDPSRLRPTGAVIASLLAVPTAAAPPPVVPTAEQELVGAESQAGDRFGRSVAATADRIAVGAYWADTAGPDAGAVYVFERAAGGGGAWAQTARLTADDGAAGDEFGIWVALSGGTLAVGSFRSDVVGEDSGAVYIFEHGPLGWQQSRKVVPADGAAGDLFGRSLALDGDRLVVGAYRADEQGHDSGAVYLFERDEGGPGNWGPVARLTADDGVADDWFGRFLDLHGDRLAVGADRHDSRAEDAGAVYVYERSMLGTWSWTAKLTAADGSAGDRFGSSVSLSGDRLAVGAFFDDHAGAEAGSAYLFERTPEGPQPWTQVARLTAPDAVAVDRFGVAVALTGEALLVGANRRDRLGADAGAAYLFHRRFPTLGAWGLLSEIVPGDGTTGDSFGFAVDWAAQEAVVTADFDDRSAPDAGAAYVLSFRISEFDFEDGLP